MFGQTYEQEPDFRYLKALEAIVATMEKCKCPLTDNQRMILGGALAVWVPEPAANLSNVTFGQASSGLPDAGAWPFGKNKQKGKP